MRRGRWLRWLAGGVVLCGIGFLVYVVLVNDWPALSDDQWWDLLVETYGSGILGFFGSLVASLTFMVIERHISGAARLGAPQPTAAPTGIRIKQKASLCGKIIRSPIRVDKSANAEVEQQASSKGSIHDSGIDIH